MTSIGNVNLQLPDTTGSGKGIRLERAEMPRTSNGDKSDGHRNIQQELGGREQVEGHGWKSR